MRQTSKTDRASKVISEIVISAPHWGRVEFTTKEIREFPVLTRYTNGSDDRSERSNGSRNAHLYLEIIWLPPFHVFSRKTWMLTSK